MAEVEHIPSGKHQPTTQRTQFEMQTTLATHDDQGISMAHNTPGDAMAVDTDEAVHDEDALSEPRSPACASPVDARDGDSVQSDQDDDEGSPGLVQSPLKEWQVEAVNRMLACVSNNKAPLLYGGVGSGKTRITLRFFKDYVKQQLDRATDATLVPPTIVLVIVPACVVGQWCETEMLAEGLSLDNTIRFQRDARRRRLKLDSLVERANTDNTVPYFVITTYETALSDLKGPETLLRQWSFTVWDEAHKLRNGIDKSKSVSDGTVPLKLQVYEQFDTKIITHGLAGINVFVTATPICNHQIDMLSLMRWSNMSNALTGVSNWKDKNSSVYRQAKIHVIEDHVVRVNQPPVPEIQKEPIFAKRTSVESAYAFTAYRDLHERTSRLLDAMARYYSLPTPANHDDMVLKSQLFQAQVTLCRRGEQCHLFYHPQELPYKGGRDVEQLAFSNVKPLDVEARAANDASSSTTDLLASTPAAMASTPMDPFEVLEDSDDAAQAGARDDGRSADDALDESTRKKRTLELDMTKLRLPPLEQMTKMNFLVQKCATLPLDYDAQSNATGTGKMLIIGSYVHPLQIAAHLISRELDGRVLVFEHYGTRSHSNEQQVKDFANAKQAAVLIATRGSMGLGKNIPWARQVFKIDTDWSSANEEQASGRIRRPLAQSVHSWFQYTIEYEEDELAGLSATYRNWFMEQCKARGMADDLIKSCLNTEGMLEVSPRLSTELFYDADIPTRVALPPDVVVSAKSFCVEEWMRLLQSIKKGLAVDMLQESSNGENLGTNASRSKDGREQTSSTLVTLKDMIENIMTIPAKTSRKRKNKPPTPTASTTTPSSKTASSKKRHA